jgi:hypothetical protein
MGLPDVVRVLNTGLDDWFSFRIDDYTHDAPGIGKQEILKSLCVRARCRKNDSKDDLPHNRYLYLPVRWFATVNATKPAPPTARN